VNLTDTLVVLDTCVLMPPRLSDVLMDLRARQLFSLHWSDDIEAEYVRNMQSVLGFPKTSVLRRLAAMQRCCPEWRVSFSNIDLAAVPSEVDSKDHHVAAAALALRRYADEEADSETPCDVILVTDNTADLAEVPMARCGVTVMRPGTFLDLICDSHPAETEEAVLQAVRDLRHPPYTAPELLWALRAHGARTLVDTLAAKWGVVPVKHEPAKR
jgi:hypothetical protein